MRPPRAIPLSTRPPRALPAMRPPRALDAPSMRPPRAFHGAIPPSTQPSTRPPRSPPRALHEPSTRPPRALGLTVILSPFCSPSIARNPPHPSARSSLPLPHCLMLCMHPVFQASRWVRECLDRRARGEARVFGLPLHVCRQTLVPLPHHRLPPQRPRAFDAAELVRNNSFPTVVSRHADELLLL